MSNDASDIPLKASADQGMVILKGVGVNSTLTPDAALATADKLTYAATQAIGQCAMDRIASPAHWRG